MKKSAVLISAITILLLVSFSSAHAVEPLAITGSVMQSDDLTPVTASEKAFVLYLEGLTEVADIVENNKSDDARMEKLAALKESIIQKMVEIGKVVDAWEENEKSAYRNGLVRKMGTIDMDLYNRYVAAEREVRENKPLRKLLREVNIITQYSQFELLKAQEPEEAERLGIK